MLSYDPWEYLGDFGDDLFYRGLYQHTEDGSIKEESENGYVSYYSLEKWMKLNPNSNFSERFYSRRTTEFLSRETDCVAFEDGEG